MSPPTKRCNVFRYLKWWEIPLFPVVLLLYPLGWAAERLEGFSWSAGAFLDNWLPRFRVRTSRSSRVGRFLLAVTGSYYPTFCEGFWGTVASPFKARVMRWVYLLGGILVGMLTLLFIGLAVYSGIRDHGVATTVKWTGIVIGAFIVAEAVLLLLVGIVLFAAEHLCPVKFEIQDNDQRSKTTV